MSTERKKRTELLKHVRRRDFERVSRQTLLGCMSRTFVPIARIVDKDRKILSSVVLGFSANTNFLVAYTRKHAGTGDDFAAASDHSFELAIQFWHFQCADKPLRLFHEKRLFGGAQFESTNLQGLSGRVTYAEDEQSGLCIVHYNHLAQSQQFREHYISVMTVPSRASAGSQMVHMRYQVYGDRQEFRVAQSIFTHGNVLTLVLHTGAALKIVKLAVIESCASKSQECARSSTPLAPLTDNQRGAWWSTEELCRLDSPGEADLPGPYPLSQETFDLEVYLTEKFRGLLATRMIGHYDAKIVGPISSDVLQIIFVLECKDQSRVTYVASSLLNVRTGEVELDEGRASDVRTLLDRFPTDELYKSVRRATSESLQWLSNLEDSSEASNGGPDGIWTVDDRNVCQFGRPLSRLEHPQSASVITGYHGGS